MALRKTKIVCTMGPTTENVDTIKELLRAGMNVARLNFSHGDHPTKIEMMNMVRQASKESGIPVALLLDTKGPEIRTGVIKDGGKINLVKGHKIILSSDEVEGTLEKISISYKTLPQEVSAGKHIYIADGIIDLEVESVKGNDIHCVVRNGGEIGSRKNVNVVGVKTSLPAVTEKDVEDIKLGIKQEVDFIAASFIRKPADVLEIKKLLDEYNSKIKIIAKIEDEEGLENIDDIIRVADGVMVARGDLGVQLKLEDIPLAQKRIIRKCNQANKPVITATQMLDSMISNPKPTRAEATDVANAIFDGTDAVMLSGETASGKYPVQAVETMNKIALAVESSKDYKTHTAEYYQLHKSDTRNTQAAVSKAAYTVATDINATAILAPTKGGNTARLISKFRPHQTIVAVTTSESVRRQLLLSWGIYPITTKLVNDSDAMINNAIKKALDKNLISNFDNIVILAGVPLNSPMSLNMVKVHQVCTVLNNGKKGFGEICTGRIIKANNYEEAKIKLAASENPILLTRLLDESYADVIKNVKGIILEESSGISWEKLKELNPELVFVADVPEAMKQFEDNLIVSLDGKERKIYEGIVNTKRLEK